MRIVASETREELIRQKVACDEKLALTKAALTKARSDAAVFRRYLSPAQHAQLEIDKANLTARSQELQAKLAKAKRDRVQSFNEYFREAAMKLLPPDSYRAVIEMAHDIERAADRST